MTVYYVDMAVGNNGNAGTSEGAGNAWQTIAKSTTTVGSGDKTWIKGSADYTETMILSTSGTSTNLIDYEGYASSTGDGGQATVNGGGARPSGLTNSIANGAQCYNKIANLNFTGHTGTTTTVTVSALQVFRCKFNNAVIGFNPAYNLNRVLFVDCEFNDNSTYGINLAGNTYGHQFIGCTIAGNTFTGAILNQGNLMEDCIFYSNGSIVVGLRAQIQMNNIGNSIIGCVFDGDNSATKIGIYPTAANQLILNNIFYDLHVGIEAPATVGANIYNDYNSFVDCTTDISGMSAGSNSLLAQSGDPFVDSAGRDYRLASSAEEEAYGGRDFDDSASATMGAHAIGEQVGVVVAQTLHYIEQGIVA